MQFDENSDYREIEVEFIAGMWYDTVVSVWAQCAHVTDFPKGANIYGNTLYHCSCRQGRRG